MKNIFKIFVCFYILMVGISCSKNESELIETEAAINSIVVSTSASNAVAGSTISFTTTSNLGTNVDTSSIFYVNDIAIASNTYTFNTAGIYTIKAQYGSVFSNSITITITETPVISNSFVHKVLIEEFSGTWCGNCPNILYGIDLVHQQTNKTVSVGIHLFGSDPFISNDGNSLAASFGVSGVPTGKINRTTNWSVPQYQNIDQVISEIQPSADLGLGINSSVIGNNLTVNIKIEVKENLPENVKLTVYVVEDRLFHTQANYYNNLYGGLNAIPNFEYNGVLRGIITNLNGEAISFSGLAFESNLNYALPNTIINLQNTRIVAFVTGSNGKVINVQEANIGENQMVEKL